tara:strand:+ start:110 stop:520 length:411 start_codon:yes stop_codon:yes gene_type:complete
LYLKRTPRLLTVPYTLHLGTKAWQAPSFSAMSMVPKQAAAVQQSLNDVVERIRQHPGQQQVDRAVKVDVPGKHFPQLQAAEQKIDYAGTAVEYAERHKFSIHRKAWGNAHVGEGIRSLRVADWGHELGSTLTVLDA